ncbi:MAG: hypothetical protein GC178_02825 [Flavobacteriales bacterium]|nr:hypothetical protein [Flavobacteriales bacterium]
MKKLILASFAIFLAGCGSKRHKLESAAHDSKSETFSKRNVLESTGSDTIYWLDTTFIDGRFLEIFSTLSDDRENLSCRWGNDSVARFQSNVRSHPKIFIGSIPSKLSWSTRNSLVVTNGCGTNCTYAVFFNFQSDSVRWSTVDYYPRIPYQTYRTDNDSLYVKHDKNNRWVIADTESWQTDTFELTTTCQSITFTACIDSIQIKDGWIEFYLEDDEPGSHFKRKIELK